MKREQFTQLIRSIFAAKDEEILCTEFVQLLPRFVDLELSNQEPRTLLPEVDHHLHQCPECDEVYQALLHAARSEQSPPQK